MVIIVVLLCLLRCICFVCYNFLQLNPNHEMATDDRFLAADAVVRTHFYKYFHPKEALIANGVLNRYEVNNRKLFTCYTKLHTMANYCDLSFF